MYLLDTMIVSYFLEAGREAELRQAAAVCPMAIVDEVQGELLNDKSRGGRAFDRWIKSTQIKVLSIVVGSAESQTLAQLLNPHLPDQGRGERASIALASGNSALTFVTNDKGGTIIAHRELWMPGERILGLAVFLRRLVDGGALDKADVVDEIIALRSAQRPTWWATWRTGIGGAPIATPPTST
jgi:hypothetical protein